MPRPLPHERSRAMRKLFAALAAGLVLSSCAPIGETKDRPRYLASADVRLELPTSLGSGVHIGNGVIITAAHVVRDAKSVIVRNSRGHAQPGEVLWVNTAYDIAAVAIADPSMFATANVECRTPSVGEPITANGNPAGVEFITMRGYVSGGERLIENFWRKAVVVDLTTMPGMSGGAVYDADGDVVGITVGGVGAQTGSGLGLIVPASAVCGLLGRAVTT